VFPGSRVSVITCPAVPEVGHAVADTDLAIFGTVVTYTCELGWHFGDLVTERSAECTDDGVWNETLPACEGEWMGWGAGREREREREREK
jgi:hypothetical protein